MDPADALPFSQHRQGIIP